MTTEKIRSWLAKHQYEFDSSDFKDTKITSWHHKDCYISFVESSIGSSIFISGDVSKILSFEEVMK